MHHRLAIFILSLSVLCAGANVVSSSDILICNNYIDLCKCRRMWKELLHLEKCSLHPESTIPSSIRHPTWLKLRIWSHGQKVLPRAQLFERELTSRLLGLVVTHYRSTQWKVRDWGDCMQQYTWNYVACCPKYMFMRIRKRLRESHAITISLESCSLLQQTSGYRMPTVQKYHSRSSIDSWP